MISESSLKELIKAIERLTDAILQIDQAEGKKQADILYGSAKERSESAIASTTVFNQNLLHSLPSTAMANLYTASPLKQTGMPDLLDIHMQKYTRPREQLLSIAEEYAQSGRQLSQGEIQSIMRGINQQVAALQGSEKLIATETSLTPNAQRIQEKIFDTGARVVEGGIRALDSFLLGGTVKQATQETISYAQESIAPALINQVLTWLLERGTVK